jgi:hypothetical protein
VNKRLTKKKNWIRLHPFATVSLMGLAIGLIGFQSDGGGSQVNAGVWVGLAGMGLCVGAPICFYITQASRAIDAAMQPVPSPEQIRLQFIQTRGREPTVQEVAALHQVLMSQHNQDLLHAGILVGGAVLGARAIRGKPLS